ncbi:RNA-directed DNA polymerase, eukaryota [Tanacetum coccineum]
MDDGCLNPKDVSNALLGKVKESHLHISSLSNLKTAFSNEGFTDVNVRYMGALWVLLEFATTESKDLFKKNVGMESWFSVLKQASLDFIPDGRIVWVEVEGVPFKLWSRNTFKRIAAKWGDLLDVDDQGESCFHSKRLCLYTKFHMNIFLSFKMIFRGKVSWIRAKEVPGWIPDLLDESDDEDEMEEGILEDGSMKGDNNVNDSGSNGDNSDIEVVPDTSFDESNRSKKKTSEDPFNIYSILNRKDDQVDLGTKCDNLKTGNSFVEPIGSDEVRAFGGSKVESACSGSFKKSVALRSGGSFLGLMDEVVKVGQTMGYNMEGCETNLSEIIKSQGASMVYR